MGQYSVYLTIKISQHYFPYTRLKHSNNLFSGVDQYLAILDPLEYPFKATKVVSWQMISLVWGLSLTSSLGTAFQMVTAARHSPW